MLRVATGKTVSLIRLTLLLPAMAGSASEETTFRLDGIATAWGLAYQIIDDFKDLLMSEEETGKSTSRDSLLGRPSFPVACISSSSKVGIDFLCRLRDGVPIETSPDLLGVDLE